MKMLNIHTHRKTAEVTLVFGVPISSMLVLGCHLGTPILYQLGLPACHGPYAPTVTYSAKEDDTIHPQETIGLYHVANVI